VIVAGAAPDHVLANDRFTVSEFDPAKLLTAAVIDQARKHRKRPPDEVRRIEERRQIKR
jgi:hypothetical protein